MGVDNLWLKLWEICNCDGEGGELKWIYEQINGFIGIYKYWQIFELFLVEQ